MPNLLDVHAQALDFVGPKVAAITDDQWTRDSVNAGWTVRDLTNHLVSGNFWVAELVAGKTIEEVGDRLDGDVLGDDAGAAYAASATAAATAFAEPGAMDRPVAVSYGPVPGSVYCGHRFIDVLIHGWDIAESTAQDANLPLDLVEACWEVVQAEIAAMQDSGAFGEPQPVPDGADLQTKLLAALGRRG
jgi:uncharacterized protein (TIGR03086 family)